MNNGIPPISSPRPQTPQTSKKDNDVAPEKSSPADTLSLSSQAQKLNASREAMDTQAPFDTDKVESIKTALANGQYTIDAKAIAEKITDL